MKAASKYGSFIIEINGDYVGVNNASNPTNRKMHFDMLAEINQYIRAMESLGVAANLIYAATITMLGAVDCVRFSEACSQCPKYVNAIVDEYSYEVMRIMFQHFECDQQMKCYKLTDFSAELNELNKKFDTEENRQCLNDLLGE